ncbi:helix-turn-helix transcriptional regulator [Kitasatospora sp. RG8]|uniref:helix-turn-helix domain-containing protein n=1 Tax=Kitasatospora sp. RG8 TaxID=2820815 RepID=UPI0027DDA9AF|nr:helix-turn-helix transcriptional regulator [Kitasatospora sp. RG8]
MARRKVDPGDRPRTWGDELAHWRQAAGLRQDEVAGLVNIHQTRVSQFELSKAPPTLKDAEMFDRALGTGGQLVRSYELIAPYLHDYHPDWFQEFAKSEAKAVVIRQLQTGRISGLLQTERYMRALFVEENEGLAPNEIDDMVTGRMERQRLLLLPDEAPLIISILEQATLERVIGEPDVMAEQLQHLIDMMSRPNVIIQVLPYRAAARAWMPGMVLLEMPNGRRRVYSESLNRGHFIDDAAEVRRWAAHYDRARAAALSDSESLQLIHRIMRGLSNSVPSPRSDERDVVQEQLLGGKRRRVHRGGPRIPRPRPGA